MNTNEHNKDGGCGCGHSHTHEHTHEEGCGCGHSHTHEHTHEEGCGCGHSHTHEHTHEDSCGCGHSHSHDHSHKVSGPDETLALLSYMLDHNRHHAEDLHEIYHSLEANGKKEAANILHEAMDDFNKANDKLEQALKLIK